MPRGSPSLPPPPRYVCTYLYAIGRRKRLQSSGTDSVHALTSIIFVKISAAIEGSGGRRRAIINLRASSTRAKNTERIDRYARGASPFSPALRSICRDRSRDLSRAIRGNSRAIILSAPAKERTRLIAGLLPVSAPFGRGEEEVRGRERRGKERGTIRGRTA